MRNAILFCLLCMSLVCCSKKEAIKDEIPQDIPAWLRAKIISIQKEEHGQLYLVSEYKIDGVTFYNVSSPISSCMLCQLFDVQGAPVKLTLDAQADIKQVRVIWPVIAR